MTRMHTGLAGVVRGRRPGRARAAGRVPSGSSCALDTLPGVGASLAKKLRPLGLETVGDLLLRRPRRYEAAADEIAISQLWGDEEIGDRRRRARASARAGSAAGARS